MEVRAWLRVPGDERKRLRARDALIAEGVEVTEPPGTGEPGVVVVPKGTPAVETITACRRANRIVVVPEEVVAEPWRLLAAGASDVIPWGVDGTRAMRVVAATVRRWAQVDSLVTTPAVTSRLIGDSPAWLAAVRWLVEIARFSDASVLITGESGTGKELAARLVHALDARRHKGPFVVVDCTTIVESLSGPELFGHERGAYTGADTARTGAFAEADGGVLFLDEIGDLPMSLQPELLRVLQERTVKAVGSRTWRDTDFRLVCATNRDLAELERAGRFRRDLRYRLSAATVRLPPLGERASDIPTLAGHFLSRLIPGESPEFDESVRRHLRRREYPGNVRELRQLVTQIAIRHAGGPLITIGMLPDSEWGDRPPPGDDSLERAVRTALAAGFDLRTLKSTVADLAVSVALAEEDGNLVRAARRLGVTRRALELRRAEPARATSGMEPLWTDPAVPPAPPRVPAPRRSPNGATAAGGAGR